MQQRKSTASGRPSGTDGSDFSYRMVVDSRYTKVARGKSRLSKLIFAQAAIQLIGLLFTFVLNSKEEGPNPLSLSSASLGLVSLIIGELGRKRSRVSLLRVCVVASSIAVLLSVFSVVRTNSILEQEDMRGPWEKNEYLNPGTSLQVEIIVKEGNRVSIYFIYLSMVINNPSIWETKKFELLETARVLIGSSVQIFLVSTTISLVHNMSPPKKSS